MKVRIGGNQLSGGDVTNIQVPRGRLPSAADIQKAERAVEQLLSDNIIAAAKDLSPRILQNIAERAQAAALAAALQIFPAILGQIDNQISSRPGVRLEGGYVPWKPLSLKYALSKSRRARGRLPRRMALADQNRAASQAGGFFIFKGNLRSYFARQSRSIVMGRFGGIRVQTDTGGLGKKAKTFFREANPGESDVKAELGRVKLTIFPAISPSLMPGLASGRWSDVTQRGAFERAYMPTGVANKLSGGRGPYRSLVLPVVQFFVLNRIPAEIARVVNRATLPGRSIDG